MNVVGILNDRHTKLETSLHSNLISDVAVSSSVSELRSCVGEGGWFLILLISKRPDCIGTEDNLRVGIEDGLFRFCGTLEEVVSLVLRVGVGGAVGTRVSVS